MGEEVQVAERHAPLLGTVSSSKHEDLEQQPLKIKTGTIWTGTAHIITGVIGAGVLSLSWSIAQLGWVAGISAVFVFAGVTLFSTYLLCDCYRSPDPSFGPHLNPSYTQAVRHFLGGTSEIMSGVVVQATLYGCSIAYTITAAASMRAIEKSDCFHEEGHEAECLYGDESFMLLFGCVQVIMSQIPNFHNIDWLSILASIMAVTYSSVGLVLGLAKVIGNGTIKGSIGGVPASSSFRKMSLVFQALGDIVFAFPYAIIVLEIEDTLRSPPPENQTMKKASMVAILITTFFYLFCGCFGYAAFGDETPGNILTGFGFYEPYWLIDLANAFVVIHMLGGYQIFSQPVFAFVEGWLANRFPNSGFVNNFYSVKLPLLPRVEVNPLRICFRTAYVASTIVMALLFPYFNQVLGVLGALSFWPLCIYFPVEMYMVQKKMDVWTTQGVLLKIFSAICLLVSIVALFGSVEGIVNEKFSSS